MPDLKCKKCGSENIYTEWHQNESGCSFEDRINRKVYGKNEHLHYNCRNCNYVWIGKTLNKGMTVYQVIEAVQDLNKRLHNVENLSIEHHLSVETDGEGWVIKFLGGILLRDEDYCDEEPLENQMLQVIRDIQKYLNIILPD